MKSVLTFLNKLEKNNKRDWFKANKAEYDAAREDLIGFVGEMIIRIGEFDPLIAGLDAKKCLFRIYRDVRFSKDKSPYKLNMGASINPGGKKSIVAGYYIHIQPRNCFLAGGRYMPDGNGLLTIRNSIIKKPKEYLAIEKDKMFKKFFGKIHGDKLKTAPRGFPKDHPMIDQLRLKSFIAYHERIPEKTVKGAGYTDYATDVFRAMKPLIDFLRKATEGKT